MYGNNERSAGSPVAEDNSSAKEVPKNNEEKDKSDATDPAEGLGTLF